MGLCLIILLAWLPLGAFADGAGKSRGQDFVKCPDGYKRLAIAAREDDRAFARAIPRARTPEVAAGLGAAGAAAYGLTLTNPVDWISEKLGWKRTEPSAENPRPFLLPKDALASVAISRLAQGTDIASRSAFPAMNLLEFQLQAEFHQSPELTKEDYEKFKARFGASVDEIRKLDGERRGYMEKIDSIRMHLCREFVRNYCFEERQLTSFPRRGCGNCVSQSLLYLGMLDAAGVRLPPGMELAIQTYPDHVRPVVIDREKKILHDLVYGTFHDYSREVVAPVYHPNLLYYEFLERGGYRAPVDPERALLRLDTTWPPEKWYPDKMPFGVTVHLAYPYDPIRGGRYAEEMPAIRADIPCEVSGDSPPGWVPPHLRGTRERIGRGGSSPEELFRELKAKEYSRLLFRLHHQMVGANEMDELRKTARAQGLLEDESVAKFFEYAKDFDLVFLDSEDKTRFSAIDRPRIEFRALSPTEARFASPFVPFYVDRSKAASSSFPGAVLGKNGDIVVHDAVELKILQKLKAEEVPRALMQSLKIGMKAIQKEKDALRFREYAADPWKLVKTSDAEQDEILHWLFRFEHLWRVMNEARDLYALSDNAFPSYAKIGEESVLGEAYEGALAFAKSVKADPESAIRRFAALSPEERRTLVAFVAWPLKRMDSGWKWHGKNLIRRAYRDAGNRELFEDEDRLPLPPPNVHSPFQSLADILAAPGMVRVREPAIRKGETMIPLIIGSTGDLPFAPSSPRGDPKSDSSLGPEAKTPAAIELDSSTYLDLMLLGDPDGTFVNFPYHKLLKDFRREMLSEYRERYSHHEAVNYRMAKILDSRQVSGVVADAQFRERMRDEPWIIVEHRREKGEDGRDRVHYVPYPKPLWEMLVLAQSGAGGGIRLPARLTGEYSAAQLFHEKAIDPTKGKQFEDFVANSGEKLKFDAYENSYIVLYPSEQ